MVNITIEGYEEYDLCGDEYLNESQVTLTFSDEFASDVVVTLENYVAGPEARITISRHELVKVLNFFKEN